MRTTVVVFGLLMIALAGASELSLLADDFMDAYYQSATDLEYPGEDESQYSPAGGDRYDSGDMPADSLEAADFAEEERNHVLHEEEHAANRLERAEERDKERLQREAKREARASADEEQHLKNVNFRKTMRQESNLDRRKRMNNNEMSRRKAGQQEAMYETNQRFSPSPV